MNLGENILNKVRSISFRFRIFWFKQRDPNRQRGKRKCKKILPMMNRKGKHIQAKGSIIIIREAQIKLTKGKSKGQKTKQPICKHLKCRTNILFFLMAAKISNPYKKELKTYFEIEKWQQRKRELNMKGKRKERGCRVGRLAQMTTSNVFLYHIQIEKLLLKKNLTKSFKGQQTIKEKE